MNTLTKRRQEFYKYLKETNTHGIHFPEDEIRQALQVAESWMGVEPENEEMSKNLEEANDFVHKVLVKHGLYKSKRRKTK